MPCPPQEAQDIFGDVNELLEMYESRKAAGAAARCGLLALQYQTSVSGSNPHSNLMPALSCVMRGDVSAEPLRSSGALHLGQTRLMPLHPSSKSCNPQQRSVV